MKPNLQKLFITDFSKLPDQDCIKVSHDNGVVVYTKNINFLELGMFNQVGVIFEKNRISGYFLQNESTDISSNLILKFTEKLYLLLGKNDAYDFGMPNFLDRCNIDEKNWKGRVWEVEEYILQISYVDKLEFFAPSSLFF